jgi:hypothetical protein
MSKTETTKTAATETKVKRTRAPAQDRVMYLVSETELTGPVHLVKNGDALVEIMDKAHEAGQKVHYRKVTVPAGR